MKRPILHTLLFIICLSVIVTNCSTPLDPATAGEPAPPIIITITDTVVDTLIQNGTDTLIDTLYVSDADTVFVIDTVIDTLIQNGTDTLIDTLIITDTDTLFVVDTLIDTLIQNGTDTLIDTLIISDTDTLFVVDTLVDTVYIDVTDSTSIESFCGKLEKCKKKLVWQLANVPGTYRIEITIQKYDKRYPKDLNVRIDGEKYPWHPNKVDTMIVEQELAERATISIERADWSGWYHTARFCITVTRIE